MTSMLPSCQSSQADADDMEVIRLCCIWLAGGMLMPGSHWGQIAKASSANATATRRLTGSSTATSYELAVEEAANRRLAVAFDELALAI